MPSPRLSALPACLALGVLAVVAVPALRAQTTPAWWAQAGLFAGLPTDPDTTLTVAQLNAAVTTAVQKLDSDFGTVGGAGTALDSLVQSLANAPVPTNLLGAYYNSSDLSGPVAAVHLEPVNFAWNGGQPDPAVSGSFSARWTGVLTPPQDGNFLLEVQSNGGAQLFLDGTLVLDDWNDPGPNGDQTGLDLTVPVTVSAGVPINLELDYHSGNASALQLNWMVPGLLGAYYPNTSESGSPAFTSYEAVDFNWGTSAPGLPGLLTPGDFSVDWSGYVVPLADYEGYLAVNSSGVSQLSLAGGSNFNHSGFANPFGWWQGAANVPVALTLDDFETGAQLDSAGQSIALNGSSLGSIPLNWLWSYPPNSTNDTSLNGPVLHGEYFAGDPTTPVLVRDEVVDFNWGAGSPDPSLPADGFSVQWTGTFDVPADGNYQLVAETGCGQAVIFVDGEYLFNGVGLLLSGQTWLAGGTHDIAITYEISECQNVSVPSHQMHWAVSPAGNVAVPQWNNQSLIPSTYSPNATATLGQLRAIIGLFRARLTALGYEGFPPDLDGDDDYDNVAATIGDLQALFNFDPDANTTGNGTTFAEAVSAGHNPYDWFGGNAPTITTIEGTGQTGPPGYFLPIPWTVNVTDANGHWLVNAPITFTLPPGDPGWLSATGNDADESQTVTVNTDSRGFAWVYWKL